ncbi:MAG: acetyltransferase, partial [Catalinimonas sp.]
MENPVLIFGATTLGRTALDIFAGNGVAVYGFLDDDPATHGVEIGEVSVLGSTDDDGFLKLIGRKCEAFVAVEDVALRRGLVKMLHDRRHVMPVNAVHPSALLSPGASLGHGTLVGVGAIVNT